MANNIVELVSRELSPNVVSRLARVMGESPAATTRAASTAAPALLAGIAQRSSTEGGAAQLLTDIRTGGYDREDGRSTIDDLEDPSSRQQVAENGRAIISSTFGNRQENLLGALGEPTGLKKGALSILMSLLAPIVMRTIGRQVRERNLDAKGLSTYLGGQRAAIASVLPGPLAKTFDTEQVVPTTIRPVAHASPQFGQREVIGERVVEKKPRPLWPFLAALLAALALFSMARSRRPPAIGPTPAPIPEPAARAPEAPTIEPPAPPAVPSMQAPSEPAIGGGPPEGLANPSSGGVKALALYLASGGASGQKNDFVLEGLTFMTASSTLTHEGAAKVDELAVLLKSHPNSKIKLVGHTDNAGDPEANRLLSQDRANSTRDELIRQGIAPDRIETAGVGSDDPVAKNDSPANRQKNRRIDVIVISP